MMSDNLLGVVRASKKKLGHVLISKYVLLVVELRLIHHRIFTRQRIFQNCEPHLTLKKDASYVRTYAKHFFADQRVTFLPSLQGILNPHYTSS